MTITGRRLSFLTVTVTLALITLACAFLGPGSVNRAVVLIQLPTLTPTRLPTLTPTTVSTPVAVAQAVEPEAVATVVETVGSAIIPPASTLASADAFEPDEIAGLTDPAAASLTQTPDKMSTPAAGEQVDRSASLPTATAAATLPPSSTPTPSAMVTPPPTDTPIPTPTATSTPLPQGWVFNGVRAYAGRHTDDLLLYGNLINNTGVAQELFSIAGTFYDGPGQVVAGADRTYAYLPAYVVPQGGSMPFELIADDLDNVANFELSVEAEPSGEAVQDAFDFLDLNHWFEDRLYCVAGRVKSLGGNVDDYLVIAAVLYDADDNVIHYGDSQRFGRVGLGGEATLDFDICVDAANQDVARYELQAWGQ